MKMPARSLNTGAKDVEQAGRQLGGRDRPIQNSALFNNRDKPAREAPASFREPWEHPTEADAAGGGLWGVRARPPHSKHRSDRAEMWPVVQLPDPIRRGVAA